MEPTTGALGGAKLNNKQYFYSEMLNNRLKAPNKTSVKEYRRKLFCCCSARLHTPAHTVKTQKVWHVG